MTHGVDAVLKDQPPVTENTNGRADAGDLEAADEQDVEASETVDA